MKRLVMFVVCGLMTIGCSKHDSSVPNAPTLPANLNITGSYTAYGVVYTLIPPCPNNVCSYDVNVTVVVTQSGDELTGSYSDSNGISGTLVGNVSTDTPSSESGTFNLLRSGYSGSQAVFSYTATPGLLSFVVQSGGQNPFVQHASASKNSSSSSVSFSGLGL
jgi:hypothetical protein